MIERGVAQTQLLARHLFVILLQRFEVLVAARFVHHDRLGGVGRLELVGQPHIAGDMPQAPVGVAVRMRLRHDDGGLTGPDRHEKVGEQDPSVIVAHLRIGQAADVESHAGQRVSGCPLQQRSGGDAVGKVQCTVVVPVLGDEFGEPGKYRHSGREGFGQLHDAVDLLFGSGADDVERGHRHAVLFEEPVPAGGRVDVDHPQQLRVDAVDVVTLLERVEDHLPVAVDGLGHIHHGDHLVQMVGRQQGGDLVADELGQRDGVRVGVEEHEAGEAVHRYFDQPVGVLVDGTGQGFAQHAFELPVQVV